MPFTPVLKDGGEGHRFYGYMTWLLAALLWLFLFRRERFAAMRATVVLSSAGALALYVIFPLAPPRFSMAGAPWWLQDWTHSAAEKALSPTDAVPTMTYNPYAAMPSVHTLWAILAGLALMMGIRQPALRPLAALFPAAMILTVISTGNHYVVDCLAATALVTVSALIADLLHRVALALNRALAFSTIPFVTALLRRKMLADVYGRDITRPGKLQDLQGPLWLCAVICGGLALVGGSGRLALLLVALITAALGVIVWRLRSGQALQLRRAAPLTDGLAGLLFVAGASGLSATAGHAGFYLASVLWIAAGSVSLLGRLRSASDVDVGV